MAKTPLEILKEQDVIIVRTRLTGKLKECFIQDLERGYTSAHLTKHAIRALYEPIKKNEY